MGSNLYFIQVQIGRLPLKLTCMSDGMISITRAREFGTLIDFSLKDTYAVFDGDGIHFDTQTHQTSYEYDTPIDYKKEPLLLEWLQAQNLVTPVFPKETN